MRHDHNAADRHTLGELRDGNARGAQQVGQAIRGGRTIDRRGQRQGHRSNVPCLDPRHTLRSSPVK